MGDFAGRGVDHHQHPVERRVDIALPGAVVDDHDDHSGLGARAAHREAHPFAHQARPPQAQQRRGAVRSQQVQGLGAGGGDVRRRGGQVRAGQQAGLDDPPVEVAPRRGQAPAPPVGPSAPVDGVEVVARVARAGVQRLAAQQLAAPRPQARGLPQGHHRQAHRVHAHPVRHGRRCRQLVGQAVEQRLALVGGHVGHRVGRLVAVGRRGAPVAHLVPAQPPPVGGQDLHVPHIARQRQAHQVAAPRQVRAHLALIARLQLVGVGQLPVAQALAGARVDLGEAAAVDPVAHPVVQGPDPQGAQAPLTGPVRVRSACARRVPPLAVQVDPVPHGVLADLVQRPAKTRHRLHAVAPHQVQAQPVHPVIAHPRHARVDHEPFAHRPARVHPAAPSARFHHRARLVEAVVVARHHPVQHRAPLLPPGRHPAEHLIDEHLHAHAVQRPHHGPHLPHASAPVLMALARVGSLRRHPVPRVAPPAVGVRARHRRHRRLGGARGPPRPRRDPRRPLARPLLGDRREIEHRQQLHRIDAGAHQLAQMPRPRRVRRERPVRPPQILLDAAVRHRELPHVQLVDHASRVALHHRTQVLAPRRRLQLPQTRIHRHRAPGVHRQRRAVGVGHPIDLHPPRRRREHLHLPQVLRARAHARARAPVRIHLPPAVPAPHRRKAHRLPLDQARRPRRVPRVPRQQHHRQRRRRPQRETRSAVHEVRAQRRRPVANRRRPAPQAIHHRPHLHPGEAAHPAADPARALDHDHLPPHQHLHVRALQVRGAPLVDDAQTHVVRQPRAGLHQLLVEPVDHAQRHLEAAVPQVHHPVLQTDGPVRGAHQGEAHAARARAAGEQAARPRQGRLVDPQRPELAGPRNPAPHQVTAVMVGYGADRPGCEHLRIRAPDAGMGVDGHGAPPS